VLMADRWNNEKKPLGSGTQGDVAGMAGAGWSRLLGASLRYARLDALQRGVPSACR